MRASHAAASVACVSSEFESSLSVAVRFESAARAARQGRRGRRRRPSCARGHEDRARRRTCCALCASVAPVLPDALLVCAATAFCNCPVTYRRYAGEERRGSGSSDAKVVSAARMIGPHHQLEDIGWRRCSVPTGGDVVGDPRGNAAMIATVNTGVPSASCANTAVETVFPAASVRFAALRAMLAADCPFFVAPAVAFVTAFVVVAFGFFFALCVAMVPTSMTDFAPRTPQENDNGHSQKSISFSRIAPRRRPYRGPSASRA